MATIHNLTHEITLNIFSFCTPQDLKQNAQVCKEWDKVRWHSLFERHAFGKKAWEKYYGNVGKEPKLNYRKMMQIYASPCPFWEGKKVYETHTKFVLIPPEIEKKKLIVQNFGKYVEKPKTGNATRLCYSLANRIPFPESSKPPYWIILTKDLISQENIDKEYTVPKVHEAVFATCLTYVSSGSEKTCLFPFDEENSRNVFTHCEESINANRVGIGNFDSDGLVITDDLEGEITRGTAALRKFEGKDSL